MSDNKVMDALMGKLYEIVAAKDTITNIEREVPYVSFTRPGIPLTKEALDFGFVTMDPNQNALAADFSEIVNSIPAQDGFWNPTGRKVYDEYNKIIDQPMLPEVTLSSSEEKQLERAKKFLFKEESYQDPITGEMISTHVESLILERYKAYAANWEAAFIAYQSQLESYLLRRDTDPLAVEIWARNGPFLKQRVQRAYNLWESAGKNKVEEVQALIGNLERRGPNTLWSDRRERYRSHVRDDFQGGNYMLTKYFPQKFWDTQNGSSWMEFSFRHDEVHKVDTSKKEKYGGGTGGSFGLWSWGGKMQRDHADTFNSADTSNFSMKVELAKIPLRRTWMDAGVFSSRAWKFDPEMYPESEHLSNGEIPPAGTMVAYPSSILVARNLELNIDMSSTQNSFSHEKITGSARGGWGPFSVKGNYHKETSKQTHDFVSDHKGIKAAGMQIIGFVNQPLPKCPNPDDELNWPE